MPPYPEQSLNSWRFDGTGWLTNTRTAPLVYNNLQLVESWSGHALQMIGPSGLLALPNNQPDGTPNLTPTEGTIRFWFAPGWTSQPDGTGPGTASRLFEVGAWSPTAAQGWWSLAVSPDGTLLGLLAQDANGQTTILQVPIRWHSGEWHQVALSWSSQETVLFLDGLRAATSAGVSLAPLTSFTGIQGFSIGSDVHGGQLAGGLFEEVFTFDRACGDLEVAADFARTAPLAALGPITLDEEQAMIAAAALGTSATTSASLNQMALNANQSGVRLVVGRPDSGELPITLENANDERTYVLWEKDELNDDPWNLLQSGLDDENQPSPIPCTAKATQFFLAEEQGFKGLDRLQQNDPDELVPPDTMAAVGPDHIVELLNGVIAVYDKATWKISGEPMMTREFFSVMDNGVTYPQGQMMVDPRIFYDHERHRWIACAIDGRDLPGQQASKQIILAVSNGDNPDLESGWTKHLINVARPESVTDYDTLGLDANGIYLAVLHLGGPDDKAHTVVAIKKPDLYQGSLQQTTIFIPPNQLDAEILVPAVNYDHLDNPNPPSGAYAWFVAKGRPNPSVPTQAAPILYLRLHWVSGTPSFIEVAPNQITSAVTDSQFRDYFDLDLGDASFDAPQKDTNIRVDLSSHPHSTGSRLMTAVIRGGSLWTCQHVGLDGTDGDYDGNQGNLRTGIQILQLTVDPSSQQLSYTLKERIYDSASFNPYFYYFPSVTLNVSGDLVAGFSGSSSSSYISGYYWWRLSGGLKSSIPLLTKLGVEAYAVGPPEDQPIRAGDYSSTSLDPSDRFSFWTIQQYTRARPTGDVYPVWGTWIMKTLFQP